MGGDDFERLEKCNAQWDIWIDQEEYGKIEKLVSLGDDYRKILNKAFEHENCTDDKATDKAWCSLFEESKAFQITITHTLTYPKSRNSTSNSNYIKYWARFFFAKFIRAKIQEKGSDCYFRRLDQVIAYLGRHQPQVDRDNEKANKLAVLYLLEMAASGEGPDQRSFAERARKLLKDYFDDKSGQNYFFKFYDLLARYNKGVGYQHEGRLGDSAREFNYILYELKNIYPHEDDTNGSNENKKLEGWKQYADNRKGFNLIFLPAVIGKAAIQIKDQLAYHTMSTLKLNKWREWQNKKDKYINAKCSYLLAEACRLSGDFLCSEKYLAEIAKFLSGRKPVNLNDYAENLDIKGSKCQNIVGRLIDTLVALRLDQLRDQLRIKALNEKDVTIIPLLLQKYWIAAEISATNREGYLRLVAEIMCFLSKIVKDDKIAKNDKIYVSQTLREIYVNNRIRLLEYEGELSKGCKICAKKGIDLRRLRANAYDDFRKHLTEFFQNYIKSSQIPKDQKKLRDRLLDLEKKRENLEWRKRKLNYIGNDTGYSSSWCETCLPNNDSGFLGLLACRPRTKLKTKHGKGEEKQLDDFDREHLDDFDYEHIMDAWDKHFLEHLESRSVHNPYKESLHFLGLQRWNSTSPAQGRSLGGGYLIYHTNERGCIDWGIAIDPGFDFVRNLFHAGFSLSDIDLVLLSHAHIDHLRDFESMVNLYLELDKRKKIKKRPHVIMTLGVYHRLAHVIKSTGLRKYLEPYIIDIEKELDDKYIDHTQFTFIANETNVTVDTEMNALKPIFNDQEKKNAKITVRPIRAYHNDFSEYSDSFGFIIKIETTIGFKYCFGYTGDTSWDPKIMNNFKDCDGLLIHLGSLIDREKRDRRKFSYYYKPEGKSEKCWELAKEKNHPYLMGMLHFFKDIQKLWPENRNNNRRTPVVLMSEFGEELRGKIRLDLRKRLHRTFPSIQVLPVDVGLDVWLDSDGFGDDRLGQENLGFPKVFCVICNDFVKLEQVDFETHGHDEALFCVCKTCRKSTPLNVMQERLKSLHEIGRRLRKDDQAKGAPSYQ